MRHLHWDRWLCWDLAPPAGGFWARKPQVAVLQDLGDQACQGLSMGSDLSGLAWY